MELHGHSQPAVNPRVVFTELGQTDGVLLHLETQKYYGLNETCTFIWLRFAQGLTVDEVCRAVVARFEVSEEQARIQVRAITEQFLSEQLLSLAE